MVKAKYRSLFQKFTIAAMVFAMFGFGFVRWLRLEEAPKRKINIAYDSNLRDQIAETKPVVVIPPTEKTGIKNISNQLIQANNYINAGQVEQSIGLLEQAERDAYAIASDQSNPNQEIFKTVSGQIVSIAQNIRGGQKTDANREILDLIKLLNVENQKNPVKPGG